MTGGASPTPLVIRTGMVGALGADAATNCAASRAGISRASALEHYQVRSGGDGQREPVIGHQATLFTRGFEGDARLVRLAHGALADLAAQLRDVDWRQWRQRFYVSLPNGRRTSLGAELIADAEMRRAWQDETATPDDGAENVTATAPRARRILQQVAGLAHWPAECELAAATDAGHAGGIALLAAAVADLAAGVTDVAIILGVDSLLDEGTLDWLHLCGRLKCDAMPAGCQPGEAAVAIALTAGRPANGIRPVAVIRGLAQGSEAGALLSGGTPSGVGLADVVARAWSGADRTAWVVSDHNGEFYRAVDWGNALVRLRARGEAFADPVTWYPATSFGDTGAVSSLVGICLVGRAWSRAYAPASTAVIAAASDGPERAAAVLADPRAAANVSSR